MGREFWFGYMAFFVFVFPLFFSFMGDFQSSPIMSTIALLIGGSVWGIFILWTYNRTIFYPSKRQKNIRQLMEEGYLVHGKVLSSFPIKIYKNGNQRIEVMVEFTNLTGTLIRHAFQFTDRKPDEKRYEQGKIINVRLNMIQQSPAIIIEGMEGKFSAVFGFFCTGFVILYMFITYIVHYNINSNGNDWQFLTLWHPWVLTPILGILLFNISGLFGRLYSEKLDTEEKLLLYGKKATAVIQRAEQTGTYINEQPQIKYILNFTDDKGKEHVVSLKKIVLLTDLHRANTGTQDILYLPEDPTKIIFASS